MADITMPQLGETVTEGTITRWFKQVGDEVALDEALFEVSTDKVDTEVPSPVAGVLAEILAGEGDLVEVGQILAQVREAGEAPPAGRPAAEPVQTAVEPPVERVAPPAEGVVEPQVERVVEPAEGVAAPPVEPAPAAARFAQGIVLSPVVRRLISENNLDPSTLTGTGLGGRITRADVEQAIRARAAVAAEVPGAVPAEPEAPAAAEVPGAVPAEPEARAAAEVPGAADVPAEAEAPTTAAAAPSPPPAAPPEGVQPSRRARRSAVPAVVVRSGDRVVPLNNIRRRTAEHMVMSKQTSPHVLTAIEVDYEGVETVRRAAKQAWKAEEGFSLTYLPFIARAVIDALRDYPHLNASFGGDELVVHAGVNLAIAVDIDFQGLLAPVIHGAEGKRLRQIARDIVDLANRARSRKLGPDDLSGGTFTLTNAGQYGTMMQFPIINQPQVAIMSTDGVSRKPVAVTDAYGNESIAIHSVGVLAMAWDHRAFDGAYAAAFLHRVKELIETRDWEAEIR